MNAQITIKTNIDGMCKCSRVIDSIFLALPWFRDFVDLFSCLCIHVYVCKHTHIYV